MTRKHRGHNEGSVYRRSNRTWRGQITNHGKRHGKTFDSKTEALAWIHKTLYQLDGSLDLAGGKIKLEEYLLEWLDSHCPSLSPKTAHQYQQIIQDHIIPHLGKTQLKELKLSQIESYYSDLRQSNIGERTIGLTHAILHKALEKAVKYDLILRNPANGAALPKYQHPEMTFLEPSQVTRFLIAAQGSDFEALYYLATHTGLRQGELFGIKWMDLRWESGSIQVQRQVRRIPGQGWTFANPKTKAGIRTIKIGQRTLEVLRYHKADQELLKSVAGDGWVEHDLIFPSSIGTPGHQSTLRKDFNKVLERAGLPKMRFHDLRHTAASLMLNNGVPVIVVSKILGHSKTSITLDTYGHMILEMQEDVARMMDDLVIPIKVDARDFTKLDIENEENR